MIQAANDLAATPAQVGLAWLLAHDQRVLLIPGTSRIDHLTEDIGTSKVQLNAEMMAVLDGLAGTGVNETRA